MSDHDQTLADASGDTPFGNPNGVIERTPQLETILTLDEVMSSARLVERTARICLRGDLEAEYHETLEELSTLVDEDGQLLTEGDQALSDASRVEELSLRARQLREQMQTATRRVRFRAMPDDEWRAFDKAHRGTDGKIKDQGTYNNELIAACAIAPAMTVDDVIKLRGKLGPTQMVTLANAAFFACTTGGLDVPKSPSFLPAQKPTASGRN